MSPASLAAYVDEQQPIVNAALGRYLPPADGPAGRLADAMRYSVFAGGKRLRPVLVLLASDLCGGSREVAIVPACAMEMVHTYSLIHDDLPAMDNDDFRRGRPSCHKAFDGATAILAGDALLTLAFEILAGPPCERLAARLAAELARAAGHAGMVGGQMADMLFAGGAPTPAAVAFIHERKTAALMGASLRLGAIAAEAPADTVARLGRFGERLGLAFQIADDALDVEGTREALGKTAGKDASSGKVTYPAVYGLAESRRMAAQLIDEAIGELAPFGPRADLLRDLARYAIARRT